MFDKFKKRSGDIFGDPFGDVFDSPKDTVFIVLKNDKVDAVFDNKLAAENHRDFLIKQWSITVILEFKVRSL